MIFDEDLCQGEEMSGVDSELTAQQATAIIVEMRDRGVVKEAMPEDDEARIKLAGMIVGAAKREHEKGNASPDVVTVMNILALSSPVEPSEAALLPSPMHGPLSAGTQEPSAPVQELPMSGDDGSRDNPAVKDVKARVKGFPIPLMVPDPGPFPADLTKLSMTDIRRLAGEWNRVFGSAVWNLGLEESSLMRAQQVLDNKRGVALSKIPRKDDEGKSRLAAVIEAEVNADQLVKTWRDKVVTHERYVKIFKALVRIYEANIDRLSREITARQAEEDKSRASERKA